MPRKRSPEEIERDRKRSREWNRNNPDKVREASRRRREKNPDILNEYSRKWYAKHTREYKKGITLRNKYGITLEQYNAMLVGQGGLCAICKSEGKTLCVDHCHETGRVRGLLCITCNTLVGFVEKKSNILEAAKIYLNEADEPIEED